MEHSTQKKFSLSRKGGKNYGSEKKGLVGSRAPGVNQPYRQGLEYLGKKEGSQRPDVGSQ